MEKYKSTYDRIMAEMKAEGKYHVLPESTCIKIMQELSEGDAEFNREERKRRIESELELRNINLNT
jgi:hypothetical protein